MPASNISKYVASDNFIYASRGCLPNYNHKTTSYSTVEGIKINITLLYK